MEVFARCSKMYRIIYRYNLLGNLFLKNGRGCELDRCSPLFPDLVYPASFRLRAMQSLGPKWCSVGTTDCILPLQFMSSLHKAIWAGNHPRGHGCVDWHGYLRVTTLYGQYFHKNHEIDTTKKCERLYPVGDVWGCGRAGQRAQHCWKSNSCTCREQGS